MTWHPDSRHAAHSQMARFHARMRALHGGSAVGDSYPAFHAWSVREREVFWREVWQWCDITADAFDGRDPTLPVGHGLDRMQPPDPVFGPTWFPNARLNYAEHLVRHRGTEPALVTWTEQGWRQSWSFDELFAAVCVAAQGLRNIGVKPGDRVAAYMPNIAETVIAMLAAATIGAVWASCSPDFGVQGVLDRFEQIEPSVLIAADGYHYAGKRIDLMDRVVEIADRLPTVHTVVLVPFLKAIPEYRRVAKGLPWRELGYGCHPEIYPVVRLPFMAPLFIMFSSGTTGKPKCMVHGHGGTLLQHCKEHALHGDLGHDQVLFYFTTCGWMMWNWLVSALALGTTVVLYDGSPMPPQEPDILWRLAAEERVTHFGTSAKYLALAEKECLEPRLRHQLGALEVVYSTGSPLAEHSFDWVAQQVGRGVRVSSISGGTDIISCFALGNPTLPVHRGELQCLGLGMAVEVWDADRNPTIGTPGELVCTRPFPSMPVAFWDDADGAKYRKAYFEHFPGAWRHGDWAQRTPRHGLVILGRSDATLNPGGVRIGTAEIYRQVERIEEVLESLVVGQDIVVDGTPDVRIVLFVRLRDDEVLTEALQREIRRVIREGASPHHVPKVIVQVPDIPRTVSGKITELAVRDLIHGRPVTNTEALANPQSLAFYRELTLT